MGFFLLVGKRQDEFVSLRTRCFHFLLRFGLLYCHQLHSSSARNRRPS